MEIPVPGWFWSTDNYNDVKKAMGLHKDEIMQKPGVISVSITNSDITGIGRGSQVLITLRDESGIASMTCDLGSQIPVIYTINQPVVTIQPVKTPPPVVVNTPQRVVVTPQPDYVTETLRPPDFPVVVNTSRRVIVTPQPVQTNQLTSDGKPCSSGFMEATQCAGYYGVAGLVGIIAGAGHAIDDILKQI